MKFRSSEVSLLLSLALIPSAHAIPVQYTINPGQIECHYAPIFEFETVTASFFITSGDQLKARMKLQGPIAPIAIGSSAEVLAAAMRVDKDNKSLPMNSHQDIDFENLFNDDEVLNDDDWDDDDNGEEDDDNMDDIMFQDYYYMDDDDEYQFMEDDAMDDVEVQEVRKARAERDSLSPEDKKKKEEDRKIQKKKQMEAYKLQREKAKSRKIEEKRKIKQEKFDAKKRQMMKNAEGMPIEHTYEMQDEGWYRFCVEGTHSTVTVEFELRRSSQLGKPNSKTGHIQTYERHDMLQNEKKLMAKLTAAAKAEGSSVSEEDLKTTKEQVTKMNRLLNDIREKQVNERHRLGIHKAVNEHSHSRMVVGSLFETVLYIAVSGFQVYTIRKWFSGNPILAY